MFLVCASSSDARLGSQRPVLWFVLVLLHIQKVATYIPYPVLCLAVVMLAGNCNWPLIHTRTQKYIYCLWVSACQHICCSCVMCIIPLVLKCWHSIGVRINPQSASPQGNGVIKSLECQIGFKLLFYVRGTITVEWTTIDIYTISLSLSCHQWYVKL